MLKPLSLSALLLIGLLTPLAQAQTETPAAPEASVEKPLDPAPKVRLQTSYGDILLQLDREKAPKSVANFLEYVASGAYEGTIFHRVIPGFMIQGGGYTADYQRKPTNAPIENEANNGLRNHRGTIAMARTSDPHSATNQFFINLVENSFLNYRSPSVRGWGYTVFGKVIKGMDVVERIGRAHTGAAGPFRTDVPQATILIQKAELLP